jgi:uncharacterized protein (TIGR03435 family)
MEDCNAQAYSFMFAVASTLPGQDGHPPAVKAAPASFDAVAINPSAEVNLQRSSMGMSTGGHFHAENEPLHALIEWAYDLKDFQVLGGPRWIESDRFDIRTTAGEDISVATVRTMLQALLEERFKLALHFDSRKVSVYELVVVPKELRLPPANNGSCVTIDDQHPRQPTAQGAPRVHYCGNINMNPGTIMGYGIPVQQFVGALSSELGRSVIDKTGLVGKFEIQLAFAPVDAPSDADAPSIFTALQEHLGLRLQRATAPVKVLIVDSAETPSPN